MTSVEVTIRPATPGDAAAITAVFVASRRAAIPYLPRLHSDDETRYWIEHIVLPGCAVWVAAAAGEVVGFAAVGCYE